MHIIMEATKCKADARLRQEAYECLVEIVAAYYEHLPEYISTIFALSADTITNDEEDVAMQVSDTVLN